MADRDEDGKPETPQRPGFFRRLFGGPAQAEAQPPGSLGEAPPAPEAYDPPPGDTVLPFLASLDNLALDPLEREALAEVAPTAPAEPRGWWSRLRDGLSRSSSTLRQNLVDVFTKRRLDAASLEELEDILIKADMGVAMASRVSGAVARGRYEKGVDAAEVQAIMAREIETVLRPVAVPLTVEGKGRPFVILVVGVNGSGKTTTIGKLAAKFTAEGRVVTLGAGDTFRAAAIEQLQVWGARTGATVVAREQGADAAGLVFDALTQARENGSDVVLLDTAGRLQNRTELMDELGKILRVIRKLEPSAPHAVLLVLDATVGQNAISQVDIFSRVAGVTGLVMTKLDGTARGGILVSIAEKFGLPVHFIGVGESVDDLEPFEAADFARAITGLEG